MTIDDNTLTNLLPKYYKRLFPAYNFCKWLGYSEVPREYFHRREFSFTLKDDVYLRYQTFTDHSDFSEQLIKRAPFKIDIGGVYNQIPRDTKNWMHGILQVEERELVFDIDMTDYDDVRFCCSNASICAKCWQLMQFAIRIIDKALEDDFGFEHRLWIYSGRRGVHCWVADEDARKLNTQARAAIIEYLTVVKGGENMAKKVNLGYNMAPSLKRAAKVIHQHFEDYACNKQDFLGDEAKLTKFLNILPTEVRDEFGDKMRQGKTSLERWKLFQSHLTHCRNQSSNKKGVKLGVNLVDEIMFQYTYPRLDAEVTKGLNHLLKSPFAIHPKTGRVCVPIDVDKLDTFDPEKVPTILELSEQLDVCDLIKMDAKDYQKTSIKEYVEIFNRFVKKLEKTWKGKNLAQSDIKGMEGDF